MIVSNKDCSIITTFFNLKILQKNQRNCYKKIVCFMIILYCEKRALTAVGLSDLAKFEIMDLSK